MTDASSPLRPEPARRLAAAARGLWTVEALGWALPFVIVGLVTLAKSDELHGAQRALAIVGAVLVIVISAGGAVVVPQLRWVRWRWEVRDEELDLRHGAVTEVRTLVPMARVQHVDVRRSFLQQRSGTADLVVHTAAGSTTVPMLPEAAAVAVRDRIADLARAPDEL